VRIGLLDVGRRRVSRAPAPHETLAEKEEIRLPPAVARILAALEVERRVDQVVRTGLSGGSHGRQRLRVIVEDRPIRAPPDEIGIAQLAPVEVVHRGHVHVHEEIGVEPDEPRDRVDDPPELETGPDPRRLAVDGPDAEIQIDREENERSEDPEAVQAGAPPEVLQRRRGPARQEKRQKKRQRRAPTVPGAEVVQPEYPVVPADQRRERLGEEEHREDEESPR